MYKSLRIYISLFVFVLFAGCNGASPNNAVQAESERVTPGVEDNQMNQGDDALKNETEFHFLFNEADNRMDYDAADKIVKESAHISGSVSDDSYRFGKWIVVEYEGAGANPDELDGAVARKPAYLVDLYHQKLITRGDFVQVRDLILRLAELSGSLTGRKHNMLVDFTAGLISTIAFGNTSYIGHAGKNSIAAPDFNKSGDDIIFEYHYDIGGGESVMYDHCTLRITKDSVDFKTERVDG